MATPHGNAAMRTALQTVHPSHRHNDGPPRKRSRPRRDLKTQPMAGVQLLNIDLLSMRVNPRRPGVAGSLGLASGSRADLGHER